MTELVFVSMEDWDEVWRRNQFLCAGLSRRYPDLKILFVGQPRNVARHLRGGKIRELSEPLTRRVEEFPNIWVTQVPRLGPERFEWGCRLNEQTTRRQIRAEMRRIGMTRPLLWLNPHYALHLVGQLGECGVVYDITDDWTAFSQSEALTRKIKAQDEALCRQADAVVVCSERLYEMKRGLSNRLHLIPNGVDATHYEGVCDASGPVPPEAQDWKRPIIGYTGTLHSERLDLPLLEQLAEQLGEGTLALVGPNHLAQEEQRRLQRRGNVAFTGPVPYTRLPEFMRSFDISMTPHRKTAFTESLNPLKLWEYLAAGKPIVSTDVAGFRDYPELVYLANDAGSFLRAAHQALRESPQLREARRAISRRHSWESRLDALVPVLQAASCRGAAA